MSKPRAALAKLTRPRLHAPVKRTRLFKLLDQGKHQPITWVSGPPGSGKTTLVASYLEARKLKTFWYQVDEGDRDPASLFYYLGKLAEQSRSGKRRALPYLTAEYLPDVTGFARRYFRELFRRLGSGCVLVFDNCHTAASDVFHLILRVACEELPPGCRYFAVSRMNLPSTLSRESAIKRVRLIDWPQLRLQESEAMAIGAAGAEFSKERTAAFNRQCDGWVGGLVLLLAHGGGKTPRRSFESREALFHYFAEEVLARQSDATRAVILRTAVLPYTTVSMAQTLSCNENAGAILETLYRQHYFVDCKLEGALSYRYHDLFREFLLAQLQASCYESELRALRQRAGALMESNADVPEALALYKEGHDWSAVCRLILAHAERLLDQGRWQTLNLWFTGLPEDRLRSDAWLLFWRGAGKLTEDVRESRALIDEAFASFQRNGDEAGQLRAVYYLTNFPFLAGDSFEDYERWLHVVERHLADTATAPLSAVDPSACAAYIAMLMFRGGAGNFAQRAAAVLATHLTSSRQTSSVELDRATILLHYAMWHVDAPLGNRVIAYLARHSRSDELAPQVLYFVAKDTGYWYFFNGEPDLALPYFDRAAEIARREGLGPQIAVANCYRTQTLARLGDTAAAQAALESARAAATDGGSFAQGYVDRAAAVLAAANGNFETAIQHTMAGVAAAQRSGFRLQEVHNLAYLAAYAAQQGNMVVAADALQQTRALVSRGLWRFLDSFVYAVEAHIYLRTMRTKQALKACREALTCARDARVAALLGSVPALLPDLFNLALEHGVERETVRGLITRFGVAPPAVAGQHWPWRLKIHAFGRLKLSIDGCDLQSPTKTRHKLLELLKALIAAGPTGASTQSISDLLWPDSEGDVAASNLRTAVTRLRKWLRADAAITVGDNQVCLNPQQCWIDSWAFASLTAAVDETHDELQPTSVETLTYAVSLYRGHLLENDGAPWLAHTRESMRIRFQRAVIRLAASFEVSQQWSKAEQTYQSSIERDPSAEAVYRHLMLHLQGRGRPLEAMQVYERLEQSLLAVASRKPSRESQVIYETLRRS